MPSFSELDPVFNAIREAIVRTQAACKTEADALRAQIADLTRRLDQTTEIARDALAAVDVAHAEVTLVKSLYSTATREQGEIIRAVLAQHRPAPVAPGQEGGANE